jgi:hypothetical protein
MEVTGTWYQTLYLRRKRSRYLRNSTFGGPRVWSGYSGEGMCFLVSTGHRNSIPWSHIPEPGLCTVHSTPPVPTINPPICSKANTPAVNLVPHHEIVWGIGGADPLPICFTPVSFEGEAKLPRRHFGD